MHESRKRSFWKIGFLLLCSKNLVFRQQRQLEMEPVKVISCVARGWWSRKDVRAACLIQQNLFAFLVLILSIWNQRDRKCRWQIIHKPFDFLHSCLAGLGWLSCFHSLHFRFSDHYYHHHRRRRRRRRHRHRHRRRHRHRHRHHDHHRRQVLRWRGGPRPQTRLAAATAAESRSF